MTKNQKIMLGIGIAIALIIALYFIFRKKPNGTSDVSGGGTLTGGGVNTNLTPPDSNLPTGTQTDNIPSINPGTPILPTPGHLPGSTATGGLTPGSTTPGVSITPHTGHTIEVSGKLVTAPVMSQAPLSHNISNHS